MRTGARANALARVLEAAGWERAPVPKHHRFRDEGAAYDAELAELYLSLGGMPESMDRWAPGPWDLAFTNGLIVELDEEQHFNRYRAATLRSPSIRSLSWSDDYLLYCEEFERRCVQKARGLGYWTSPSSERFFGPSSDRGDLSAPGPARWKQRAFYDAMRDAASGRILARISVYDRVNGHTIEQILRTDDLDDAHEIAELITSRIHDGSGQSGAVNS